MKLLILFVGWCILFALSWPLALLVAIALPIVWLVSLPFRFLAVVLEAMLALLRAILLLPARVLGYRR